MNGKYYWLKLRRDFFKRHDVQILEGMPNGKEIVLIYLKLLCESIDHDGNLRFSELLPYSVEMLATITRTDVNTMTDALDVLKALGMVEIAKDGTYIMPEASGMVGSSVDNDNANRQRRYRERQKQQAETVSVTKNNASVTHCVTKNNESKSKSKRIELDIESEIEDSKGKEVTPF